MKIVYLLRDYINPGGIERIVANKANYLVEAGYQIYIVSLFSKEEQPFFKFNPNITFHCLDLIDNKNLEQEFLKELDKYLDIINPDIVISTGIGVLNSMFKIKNNCHKILELHFAKYKKKYKLASLDKYWFGRIITNIYSYKRNNVAKKYDVLVSLTNEDRKDWRGLDNIVTIPNSLSFIPKSTSDLTAKKVIAVGRYTNQKGFDHLIDIWAIVNKKYPNWRLSIYGEGGKKKRLQNQINQLDLDKCIELNEPTKDVEKELINSSVYVMSSNYEGFGLVLVEAMSCGLPAISFDCKCGPKDIITEGEDGFLIKMNDNNAFAEKLCLLIENEELRYSMGQRAAENMNRFHIDKVMPQWISLFENLSSTNK